MPILPICIIYSSFIAILLPKACIGSMAGFMVVCVLSLTVPAGRTLGHRVAAGRCGVRGLESEAIRSEGHGNGGVLLQHVTRRHVSPV